MKRLIRTLLLIACAGSAVARADSAQIFTGSLGGTSDFVFRGLSLTRGKPAVQGSFDVEFPKEFYFGAFAATAHPNQGPSPNFEADLWAGRYWSLSENFSADLRLSEYTYPNDPRRITYNRTELTTTLGFRNQLFFAASYSPNTRAVGSSAGYSRGGAWALEISGRKSLSQRFSISAGVGHYDLEDIYGDSYYYWNATLTAALAPFELQLAYVGVDNTAAKHFNPESVGDRVALTALWRFSSTR